LRAALGSIDDPEQLTVVANFYRQLGRDREAGCWEEHIERLQARAAKPQ
jgi:hypothetical protein